MLQPPVYSTSIHVNYKSTVNKLEEQTATVKLQRPSTKTKYQVPSTKTKYHQVPSTTKVPKYYNLPTDLAENFIEHCLETS